MRIILVRHGESQGNIDPLAYGRIGDPHISLSEEGWKQAFRVGDFLKRYYRENPFEGRDYPQIIDTSTWIRAIQTEEAGTRHFSKTNIVFRRDEALREQSFGLLYRKHTICDPDLAKLLNDAATAYSKNPFEAVPPQGDSPQIHYDRVLAFAHKIVEEATNENIHDRLVFAHGATNRHLATILKGLPPQAWKSIQNPNNCDAWLINDNDSGFFTIKKIYDGINGVATNKDIMIVTPKIGIPVLAA